MTARLNCASASPCSAALRTCFIWSLSEDDEALFAACAVRFCAPLRNVNIVVAAIRMESMRECDLRAPTSVSRGAIIFGNLMRILPTSACGRLPFLPGLRRAVVGGLGAGVLPFAMVDEKAYVGRELTTLSCVAGECWRRFST